MTAASSDLARPTYDLVTDAFDFPVWEGPPLRTILICSHPRSGSTLLGEAMTFAGGLGCPLEYFHEGFRPTMASRWRAPDMHALVSAVWRHRTDPNGILSVKLFWRDLIQLALALEPSRFADVAGLAPSVMSADTYRSLAALMAACFPNAEFVYLSRLDRVRQAVSGFTAMQTGRWRNIPGLPERDGYPTRASYEFDGIAALANHAEACHRHWANLFSASQISPLTLNYEELARDYAGVTRRVLDALGSAAPAPAPRMLRQVDSAQEALVLRYLRERQTKTGDGAAAVAGSGRSDGSAPGL